MIQIATDPSQSARLRACGVSYKTADMTLSYNNGYYELMATPFHYGCFDEKDTPAWSLSALLALLPIEINDKGLQTKMQLEPCLNEDEEDSPRWAVSYYDYYTDANLCYNEASDPIEACVKAVEWLTQKRIQT